MDFLAEHGGETSRPLLWDFYREVEYASEVGTMVHYYDNWCQRFYVTSKGLTTKVGQISNGDWANTPLSEPINIVPEKYKNIRIDHPSNGILYGVGISEEGQLRFWRYRYMHDMSSIIKSWRINSTSDNDIRDIQIEVDNVDFEMFVYDNSLYLPGAKLTTKFKIGSVNAYPLGIYYLDEISGSILNEGVTVSARNATGYYLKDQTMDELTKVEGTVTDCLTLICEHAGIPNFTIQEGLNKVVKYVFEAKDTVLDALIAIVEDNVNENPKFSMGMIELMWGSVCIGTREWLKQYLSNDYYTFNDGEEVFSRSISKMADSAYRQIFVTGYRLEGKEEIPLTPIMLNVKSFRHWRLGEHRTKHIEAPRPMTQEELVAWARAQALIYQNIGISESFIGPFRPQLIPRDIAAVKRKRVDGTEYQLSLGVVTETTHSFSRDRGYITEFTTDSGGVDVSGDSTTVYSDIATVNGFNRKQKMADIMKVIAKRK